MVFEKVAVTTQMISHKVEMTQKAMLQKQGRSVLLLAMEVAWHLS
jgi:hypothetical protein